MQQKTFTAPVYCVYDAITRKFQKPIILSTIALLTLAASSVSHAQTLDDTVTNQASASSFGLGIGIAAQRSPYKDDGNQVQGLPIIFYNSDHVRFFGNALDWKLFSNNEFELAARVKIDGAGYKSGDAPILNGMETRKFGEFFGGTAAWNAPWARLSLEAMSGIGTVKGQTGSLSLEHSFQEGPVTFTPRLSADWLSTDYVNYYFGVRAVESTSYRPEYTGKSTVNINAGLRIDYSLTHQQMISVELGVKHYGRGITESPLVEHSSTPVIRLGYLYKF